MGAWGYGLFQSDAELDVVDDISGHAGEVANDPTFTFWHPENRAEVVTKLNAGLFHQLFEEFQAMSWSHGVIYLGALSMRLGAKIDEENMQVLRKIVEQTPMHDEAKGQMQRGLNGYRNDGEAGILGVSDCLIQPTKTVNPLNQMLMMPEPMPRGEVKKGKTAKPKASSGKDTEGSAKVDSELKENAKPATPTGKDTLGSKATLQAWFGS